VRLELAFRSPDSQLFATYEYTLATSDEDGSHVLIETWVIPRR
jgi:hypothetical protein